MKTKKKIGVAVIAVGAVLLLFANYIAKEVSKGREQIAEGQRKVDTANSVFSVTPYTKSIGKEFTGGAQKQIEAGKAEVSYYDTLANELRVAGIIIVVIGIGLFVFWKKQIGRRR